MSHPDTVVHLEHDGQVLLVNEQGEGPQLPVQGRMEADSSHCDFQLSKKSKRWELTKKSCGGTLTFLGKFYCCTEGLSKD